ncbi:MAG: hypothetical protein ACP5IZ_11935, partial [Thermoprotei archaeon]
MRFENLKRKIGVARRIYWMLSDRERRVIELIEKDPTITFIKAQKRLGFHPEILNRTIKSILRKIKEYETCEEKGRSERTDVNKPTYESNQLTNLIILLLLA